VLAFELVAGVPPFMHEDRMVMYRRIVDGVYTCPAHFSGVSTTHTFMLLPPAGRAHPMQSPIKPCSGLMSPATLNSILVQSRAGITSEHRGRRMVVGRHASNSMDYSCVGPAVVVCVLAALVPEMGAPAVPTSFVIV